MALELKGLKVNMMRLQSTVGRLNSVAVSANAKGSVLESHLGDIESQIGSHVDDIEFTAGVLGNSSGESEKPAGKPVVTMAALASEGLTEADPIHNTRGSDGELIHKE